MTARLFVIHGSHPCAAVEKALQLKQVPYRVWEWPPPLHALFQRLLFGSRIVPAINFGDGDRISGTTAILRRLDEVAEGPRLFPTESPRREQVERAEQWGDRFQQVARDLLWAGVERKPGALVSYSQHSRLRLPAWLVRRSAPAIAAAEVRIQRTGEAQARARLAALPAELDKIDALIAEGVIGDVSAPNAADLQILATVRLLMTIADLQQLLAGRTCEAAARALYPHVDGQLPAGALPAA